MGKKRKTGERFPPTQDENTILWSPGAFIPGGLLKLRSHWKLEVYLNHKSLKSICRKYVKRQFREVNL